MAQWRNLQEALYPVGSIYISINGNSPAGIIGGTWAAVTAGATLLAAGTGFPSNNYGGSHTIAASQLPAHTHPASNDKAPDGWDWGFTLNADWSSDEVARRSVGSGGSSYAMTSIAGSSSAQSYLGQGTTTGTNDGGDDYTPYGINVYIWYRMS